MIQFGEPEIVRLDYGEAARNKDLLLNLSCAAAIGDRLWTVSDEGRTLECLARRGDDYALERQVHLDAEFPDLLVGGPDDEIDLEAASFDGARLWVCGSHCRVRRKTDDENSLDARIARRASRHLFAGFKVDSAGALAKDDVVSLPATGRGSLRRLLRDDPYLAPFLKLPSKEGGLDIEGLSVHRGRALVGLRGPLIDGVAVIMEIALGKELESASVVRRHFVRLGEAGGLGVRGLARWGADALIIAGPVADADGPFQLHAWRPQRTDKVQSASVLFHWPGAGERPEGVCRLARGGADGLLVVFDRAPKRVKGGVYEAEWRRALG